MTDDRVPVGIVAATDGVGRAGEDLQFALGEGICWHAAGARRLVQAPDLSTDDRWVQFGRSAADAGIAAAFSLPCRSARCWSASWTSTAARPARCPASRPGSCRSTARRRRRSSCC
ncbi:hypothetical protein ACFQX8_19810 [Klenkia terrae]|uniref:hypothetical protein n=1 Tax=Klenkia terrae TaxID=1052259 RepID=UPI00360A4498